MKYIFDENMSEHVVILMQQLGAEVCHVNATFHSGIKDEVLLPEIAKANMILITADDTMRNARGKHGHRTVLEAWNVQVLFLPTQFKTWKAWDRAVYILRYFRDIDSQVSKMKSLRLARLTDKGNLVSI